MNINNDISELTQQAVTGECVSEPAPTKRGRGRPKIHSNVERTIYGICDAPSGDANYGNNIIFELVYDNTNELKKLASLMTKMKSENIQMKIAPDKISFLTMDSFNNICLHISIDCNKLNRYYAAYEFIITLNATNFCKIMSSLSVPGKKASSFESIAFICKENEINHGITIITKQRGGAISSDTIHMTNIPVFEEWEHALHDISLLDIYSVSATMGMDLFKNIISKAQKLSKDIRFEKTAGDKLTYQYNFRSNWGSSVSHIEDGVYGNKIVHDGRVLTFSIKAEYLRALTKLTLCETVTLHIDNDLPLILSCHLSIFDVKMIIKNGANEKN